MAGGEGLSGGSAAISANTIFKEVSTHGTDGWQAGIRWRMAGSKVGLQRFDHGIEVRV
jgi:hypothetical protein